MWDSKEDQDTCFFKAVAVAKQILENQIASANAVNRADEKGAAGLQKLPGRHRGTALLSAVEERPVQDGRVVRDLPPASAAAGAPSASPTTRPSAPSCPSPTSWAGQPQEVIEQKSGIPGISFCHASRFLITAKDKETALAACRQVLKNNGRI